MYQEYHRQCSWHSQVVVLSAAGSCLQCIHMAAQQRLAAQKQLLKVNSVKGCDLGKVCK
jgi:hypothetical protein